MQNPPRTAWTDIALLILGLLGVLLYFCVGAFLIISGLLSITNSAQGLDVAQPISMGVMFCLIGFLLVPGMWMIFQRMTGRLEPDRAAGLPFAPWHIPLILIVWAVGLFGGQWAVDSPAPAWILLPVLIPLCVFPPIWLIVGLAARGYNLQPRWRSWNALILGTTLGPFLILIAEGIFLGFLLVGVIAVVMSQPEMLAKMEMLSSSLQFAQSEEQIFALLGPLVVSPTFIAILLFSLSIVVPMIEEILKPLAVWLFARRLESRLDGFVLGAICGAAYAVFETGGVGAAAGGEWLVVLGARGGTSLLHIATSAWMGSAIVPAFRERKILQLLGVYAMAILLHGTWNAFSIFTGLGSAAMGQPGGEWLVTAGKFSPYGMGALAALLLALVIYQQYQFQRIQPQTIAVESPALADRLSNEPDNPETVIR